MAHRNYHGPGKVKEEQKQPHRTDEFGVLDDTVLESMSPAIAPSTHVRRGSYSDNTTAYSPSEAVWPAVQFSIENGGTGTSDSNQTFLAQHHLSNDNMQTLPTVLQQQWPGNRPSGSCTPTPGLEQMGDYSVIRPHHLAQSSGQSNQQSGYEISNGGMVQAYNPSGFPTSPQSSRSGWISASPPDMIDFRTVPGSTHPSPNLGGATQVLRRDGVRKKNARFEIPAERNLRTIDQLINQTSDEQEIKELKQQKRLLRNRQAALDSRQRKKQHTERLEEEKKHYTSVINELEEGLAEVRHQEREWAAEKDAYIVSQQQYQRFIDSMLVEKEEMIRRHTLETGELRKKNAMLVEQLQRLEGTAMSTVSSSNGFSTEFSDFDHLTMNNWDDFSMAHEFSIEVEPRTEVQQSGRPNKLVTHDIVSEHSEEDKAISSGILLMLLLCGAWVASQSSTSTATLIPTIPDELRSASATVLDTIYKDSGVQLRADQDESGMRSPTNHDHSHSPAKQMIPPYGPSGLPSTSLDVMHAHLTTPSEQQLREQEFSLSADQYNDLAAATGFNTATPHRSRKIRPLGEILAGTNMPNEHVAETYSRSLMKDRVSTQVLEDFARMVAQSNLGSQNQWKPEPLD